MDPSQQLPPQIPVNQQDASAEDASRVSTEAMDLQMQQTQVRVEDLPLDKKLEVLKKHNQLTGYDEGRFIDAQDTVNTWCLGSISQILDAKSIKVHYDGWSTKWDITIKTNSYKIAPFRKFSRGYTGQTRVALRQNMKFTLDELALEKERVVKLIDDDLNGLGAFETTQYLRGRLYIFVDFLLQNGKFTSEEADAVNDFIVQVLRLITAWFKKAQKLIPLYSQIKANFELFLIDENIAILLSAYELLDVLKKIFGGCHRCLKYYLLNDKAQVPITDKSVTNSFAHMNFEEANRKDEEEIDIEAIKDAIANRRSIIFGQMANFLNTFAEIGGFDAIISFFKAGNETQEEKMPLDLITLIVSPFRTCNSIFSEAFAQSFISQVKEIVSQRLAGMTEKEIKEIDKESISMVLKNLKEFLTLALTEQETAKFIEINQLNMSFRFLKSTYLEKKLKGLQEIKSMISSIEFAQTLAERRNNVQGYGGRMMINQDYEMHGTHKEKPPKFINAESLKQWLLDQKVLEIIFGENTHVEIVKRSASVIIFLAKEGALPNEVVDLVWRCQIGKHEDMVRVVYSTIQEILPEISVQQTDLFYQKIMQVPQSLYDDKFLHFLKDFTLKALTLYKKTRSEELGLAEDQADQFDVKIRKHENQVIRNISEYLTNSQLWDTDDKQYGLPVFWAMIQDGANSVSTEMTLQASACLTEILKQEASQPVKVSYLIRALDNLRKGESVAQSVILAQNIISEYASSTQVVDEATLTQEVILEVLEKQLGLIDRVIQNIAQYNGAVREKARALSEKNKALPDDVSTYVFVGKHNHQDTLDHLLGFLEFLIINSDHKVTLGTPNIDRLWQMFVQQPNSNVDQTLFLKWINKHRDGGPTAYGERREYHLFNEEERIHFFTKILCNPTYGDFGKISAGQVKCFHNFFKVINRSIGVIESSQKKILVKDFSKLHGLDTLRHIAVESENDRSREDSMNLLVDLHLKFDTQIILPEVQAKIWQDFIDHCMSELESPKDNVVSNNITLLSKFLDRYEGKKTQKTEMKQQYNQFQQSSVQVILRPDAIRQSVQMNYSQTVGQVRVKIAEAFGFQINEFIMIIKSQMVDPDEDDDRLLREFGLIQNVIIQKNSQYNPENHPKYLISKSQENYDKLFALLSKDSKSHLIESTWELLQKLPVNNKLHQEIKDLSGMISMNDNRQIWEKILDPKSINKLLYSLQIVNQMQGGTNRKDTKQNQWRYKFVQMGGLTHLLRTFLGLNIKSIETNLTLRCIELLIITLTEMMSSDRESGREQLGENIKQLLEKKEQVVHTCIMLVDMISDYCIAQEKARGQTLEELQRRIIQNKVKKNKYKAYMVQKAQQQTQEDEEDHESAEYNQMQLILKQFGEQQVIVSSLFRFMQYTVFAHDPSASVGVANYENLGQMLIKSGIQVENYFIRLEVIKRIKDIIISKSETPEIKEMLKIVKILAFDMQNVAEHNEARVLQYFEWFSQILDGLKVSDLEPLKEPLVKMIGDLGQFIYKRELKERSTADVDQLLVGEMKILRSLLQKFPQQKRIVGDYLTKHLVHDCLFDIPLGGAPSHTKVGPPKCKSHNSRQQALKLLSVLCRDCPSNLDLVLTFMHDFNMNPSWRTNKEIDWNISLMDSEKSSTGYVGIKNLGCICYMNSLFQQLFMIGSLRNSILQVPDTSAVDKDDNMFYQLQLLFAGLLKSEKQYVNPKGFCNAFKDWDGNPTNVLEQMDVEEFFNMLMDRIETAIKGSPQANTIQYHFGGKYASEMICKGCPHKYEREEAFLSVGVPVKNQKSIQQGLLASVQGEMLEGDNAYFCEKCDKKVDTLKRTCIKKLPRYLILPMKRFEFDYDRMIRVKVNDYCEFPLDLNMEPYTQEGLSKRERIQKLKEEKGEDDEVQQLIEEIEREPLKYPKEYYEYSLSGIVVHSGTADSGHYYSFIKDRDHPESGKWYEMNDALVRDFDPKDIPSECFGGEDTFQGYNMMQVKTMKLRNAYLLFYERKTPIDIQSDDEKESEKTVSNVSVPIGGDEKMTDDTVSKEADIEMDTVMSSRGNTTVQAVPLSTEIEQKILYENQKYWQNRFLFGNEYHEFVYDLSLNWNTSCLNPKEFLTKNNDFHIVNQQCPQEYLKDLSIPDPIDQKIPIDENLVPELEVRVFKFAASCYLTILQRAQLKLHIPQMLNLLKSYINKNEHCAAWLIQEFCNLQIIEELLLQCNQKEMRRFSGGLLYCAMLKVFPFEKDRLNEYWANPDQLDPSQNQTVLGNFALVLLSNLQYAKKFSLNCSQYLQLFARLSSLGKEMREFLLKSRMVGMLLQFVYEECSPHKEFFKDISRFHPKYNEHPDMGLPTVIDKKQSNQFQDMLERKRLKTLQDGIPQYKYIYEAVSYCIRGYSPPGVQAQGTPNSPYQLDDIQGYEGLIQQERDLFFPEPKFLKIVFNNQRKNRGYKFLSLAYAHYTWFDKDDYNQLLQVIQLGMNENDFQDIKPYMAMLTQLLMASGGDRIENRFEKTILHFLEIVENNITFYRFTEACFEFFFKLCAGIPAVMQWFLHNRDKWAFMIEWQQQVSFPMDQAGHNRLYKRRTNQYQQYPQYMRNESYKNTFLRESRLERLRIMLKGNPPADITEIENWLCDMEDYKFKQGELFEMYFRNTDTASQLQIEIVLDEMVQYKYLSTNTENGFNQQNQLNWLAKDKNKIQPASAYKSQYRVRLCEHYEQVHETRVRNNQSATQSNTQMRENNGDQEMQGGDRGSRFAPNGESDQDDESEDDDQDHIYS